MTIKRKTAQGVVADNRAALEKLAIKAPADGVVSRPYVLLNYNRSKAEPGRVCRAGATHAEVLKGLSGGEVLKVVAK